MGEENDAEGILRKALYVNEIPEDFNPHKIPQTGEEFIHFVMYEAKQCKEWVKAEISEEKLKKEQTIIVEPTGCISAPKEFLPSLSWQNQQISDFSAFRLHIQRLKQERSDLVTSQFNGEINQWRKKCENPPRISELLVLNQKSLFNVLNFMLEWLNSVSTSESISYSHGVWLYAILASLENPLMPETCAILREIARKCSEIRAKLDNNATDEQYRPLNLFICIIARYYNNYDLIDNVNEL